VTGWNARWFQLDLIVIAHAASPGWQCTRCGRICLGNKKINFSQVSAGQAVGINEVHDDIWLVSFMQYDLGYFDLETRVLEPLENPFGPKVLPM
jgi:putative transposase